MPTEDPNDLCTRCGLKDCCTVGGGGLCYSCSQDARWPDTKKPQLPEVGEWVHLPLYGRPLLCARVTHTTIRAVWVDRIEAESGDADTVRLAVEDDRVSALSEGHSIPFGLYAIERLGAE